MKIILYRPSDTEGYEECKRRAAKIHAELVLQAIERLSCSRKQKLALINAILAETKQDQ